ncbi:putative sucrose-phosphatase 1 [Nannochloris sp. 'desiccata']|nr:putative sucrose-phosphatase 1 [Chlorella desiccata (nom. nud.)]
MPLVSGIGLPKAPPGLQSTSRTTKTALECSSSSRSLPTIPQRLGVRRDSQASLSSSPQTNGIPRALPELQLQGQSGAASSKYPNTNEADSTSTSTNNTAEPISPNDLVVTTFRWPSQLPGSTVAVTGSFNNWGTPLPLGRTPSGDWVRSIALPPGPIQFKFVCDGQYMCSPCEAAASNSAGGAINNQRLVQSTCEFTWPSGALGGREIMVAGDWSGWGELLPLAHDNNTGVHSLQCCLPPGAYAYQFLVDGKWKLRPDLDSVHTPDGHFANTMEVQLPPAFRIFYSTGWANASLNVRGLDKEGKPLTEEWMKVDLHDTASRGHLGITGRRWKVAKIAASGENAPAALEFYPVSGEGVEDRPFGGGTESAYICPRPGGFKLRSGKLRPFMRASKPPVMLVSDLDGTLVGDGADADQKTSDFGAYWEDNAALVGSVLVYNTGRSLGQFQGLLEAKGGALPVPDALITAVGTKIFLLDREGGTRGTASGLSWQEDTQWAGILSGGWNLEIVRAAGAEAITLVPENTAHWLDDGSEHPHRIALSVRADLVPTVTESVKNATKLQGVRVQIIISGAADWRYVDVVSTQGGKLAALEYVRALFGIAAEQCVAAGDSGNDALMLGGANPAVVVGNAQDELLEWVMKQPQDGRLVVSDQEMAHGVLEGMGRLGLY